MRFNVTPTGLKHYEALLLKRVAAFKVAVADRVFRWQVPEAGVDFGDHDKHPYFSGYFRANWQVSIGGAGTSPMPETGRPPRQANGFLPQGFEDPSDAAHLYDDLIEPDKLKDFCESMSANTLLANPIVIYNPTWYGKWLNDGGYDAATVLGNWKNGHTTQGYRKHPPRKNNALCTAGTNFMQQCMDDAKGWDYARMMKDIRTKYNTSN